MKNQSTRVLSLDVFRGLTIALMVLVNTPGSWNHVYPPFLHADWHGCSPTDLVFPFFLFIVGTSLFFSNKKFDDGFSQAKFFKILKRTFLIFVIGLLLGWFPFYDDPISEIRIMGVLQRIALAYGFAAIILMCVKEKGVYIIGLSLLFLYWFILWYWGGNDPYSLESNVVRKVDRFLLGDAHLWGGKGIPFDPEGLLSTIPSIVTVFLGYLSGAWLSNSDNKQNFVRKIISAGLVLVIVGFVWGFLFPINKSLWTSSYVLYVGGIAMIVLGCLTWLIDIFNFKSWTAPFIHFGRNPLFIYILSGLYAKTLWTIQIGDGANKKSGYTYLYENVFRPILGEMNGSLFFGIFLILLLWVVAYILYKRKIIIKV